MPKLSYGNRLDLFIELVKTSFKMRYQNSILGFLWVLIKPYAMFLIMYVIFSNIVKGNIEHYPVYLLSGVVFISFVNELLILGQMALLDRANIILKVNFPRYIAIISALTGAVINLFINLVLVFIISALSGITLSITGLIFTFFVISVVFIWAIAIAFFTSIITVRIRDLKNIIELGMFIMQYATPIFYALNSDFISNKTIATLIQLNPLTVLMNQMRAGLGVYGTMDIFLVLIFLSAGLIALYLGAIYFTNQVKKIAEFF